MKVNIREAQLLQARIVGRSASCLATILAAQKSEEGLRHLEVLETYIRILHRDGTRG
jgi:hypothetical protein